MGHALRRTMEKYMATCRIFLVTNSTSKVIPAIKSMCLNIRVSAPSQAEVVSVLQMVAKKEGCNLPLELADKIASKSSRNLRRALLMAEACKVQQYPFLPNQQVPQHPRLRTLSSRGRLRAPDGGQEGGLQPAPRVGRL